MSAPASSSPPDRLCTRDRVSPPSAPTKFWGEDPLAPRLLVRRGTFGRVPSGGSNAKCPPAPRPLDGPGVRDVRGSNAECPPVLCLPGAP